MRSTPPAKLEMDRLMVGHYASPRGAMHGAFDVHGPCGERLTIISGGPADSPEVQGWEHVSASTKRRVPNWAEMCFVKALFWSDEECVVQFHPSKSEYVNNHPHCLHLWKCEGMPVPPRILVGVKDVMSPTTEEREEVERAHGLRL